MIRKYVTVLSTLMVLVSVANSQNTQTLPNSFYQPQIQPPSYNSISGSWVMTTLNGYITSIPVEIDSNSIKFTYCNTQSYNYNIGRVGRISIQAGFSTKIACRLSRPPSQDQVRNALLSVSRFTNSGMSLILRNSGGAAVAVLAPSSNSQTPPTLPLQSGSIVGEWKIKQLNGVIYTSLSQVGVSISQSSISYRYCNSKSLRYTTNGNGISIQAGTTTLALCSGLSPSESVVDNAFQSSTSYTISNGILTLSGLDGRPNVVLSSQLDSNPTLPSYPYPPVSGSSLAGNYRIGYLNGVIYTSLKQIPVQISDSAISYNYCNSHNLPYSTNGNTIAIQGGISTLRYCLDLSPSESEVDSAFQSSTSFMMSDGALTLLGSDGRKNLVLDPTGSTGGYPPVVNPPGTPASIVGDWTMVSVNGVSTLQLSKVAVKITSSQISFRYCNSKLLSYLTSSGNRISVQSGISTLIYCGNQDPSESDVDSAFSSATTYDLSSGVLTFYSSDGRIRVILKRASFNPDPQPPIQPPVQNQLQGVWTANFVYGYPVEIVVRISSNSISFTYCNSKTLSYTTMGRTINVSDGISTLAFCQGLTPTESNVVGAFTGSTSFQISGNQLTLSNGSSNLVSLTRN